MQLWFFYLVNSIILNNPTSIFQYSSYSNFVEILAQVTLIGSQWVGFITESKCNESCLTSVNSLYQNNELKNN